MERVEISMKDFLCGITTGIPICCITWFASEWHHFDGNGKDAHWNRIPKKIDEVQYIPCPECGKKGNFKDIWVCPIDADCGVCQSGGFRNRIIKPRKNGMRRVSEINKQIKPRR